MSPALIGIIIIGVLLIIFATGTPIGFSMAVVGAVGFALLVSPEAALTLMARDFWTTFSSYSITCVPMFVLMGNLAFSSGIGQRLYDAGYTMFGHMRGGLAMGTTVACAGFAAICGSTTATAASMGRVALPEMKRYGYNDALATGCVAAAGTLGIMIPPSTIFIIYGILTEQSIGRLFIAGIFPGLLIASLFIVTISILCLINPNLAPAGRPTTWKEKLSGLTGVVEMLILFALVIGGLFLGWFSATQAGAAGATGTLLIGLARRQLSWQGFLSAVKDTLRVTSMLMIILAGAVIFGHLIAVAKFPMALASWIGELPFPPMVIMGFIFFMYFVGGCFMDSLALVMLTVPIFYPIVLTLGIDPIWFGVIIVLVNEVGVITPPVGVNVFVINAITPDVPLGTIFRGIFPFLGALVVAVALLMIFPQIATFLPGLITY
ncbi:TRAP transporter large permease [Chloroflexota bacterium]